VLNNGFEKKSSNSEPAHNGNGRSLPLKGGYIPPDADHVDIFRLLEELEHLPEKARHLPLNTLVGFNHEQFYYLVLKIRAALPEEMKRANRLARDSERIVDQARDTAAEQMESGRVEAQRIIEEAYAEARHVLDQARRQAAEMVEQTEVHRLAIAQAKEIIQRAEIEAAEIRRGADDYARDVLERLEAVMGKAIVTVQRGRETLEKSRV
jgi:hypothetical protein